VAWTRAGAEAVPVVAVGPQGTLRDLLDSAVSSPARAAVRTDADGALVGVVALSALAEHLEAPALAR
jgi:hypothetical protein